MLNKNGNNIPMKSKIIAPQVTKAIQIYILYSVHIKPIILNKKRENLLFIYLYKNFFKYAPILSSIDTFFENTKKRLAFQGMQGAFTQNTEKITRANFPAGAVWPGPVEAAF